MKHTMIPITTVADTSKARTPITMAAMIPLFNPLAVGWGWSVGGRTPLVDAVTKPADLDVKCGTAVSEVKDVEGGG